MVHRFVLWLGVFLSTALLSPAHGQSAVYDEILAEEFDADGPGAAAAILEGGTVVWAGTRGLADLQSGRPLTLDTPFDLASVSKQMTALAIGILESRGQVHPTNLLTFVLRDYEESDPDRPVTVEHLLVHTSGLADYTGNFDGSDAEFASLSTTTLVHWVSRQERDFRAGARHSYNNSGYGLLARIVEERSGQTFPSFMRSNVFLPLGMSNSVAINSEKTNVFNRALGYTTESGQPRRSELLTAMVGDGNIFSTIHDLIRYELALQKSTLVPRAWLDRAFTTGRLRNGKRIAPGYGYGWSVRRKGGSLKRVFHSGGWDGTATFYDRRVGSGVTLIVLSNDENADPERIARRLFKAFVNN